MTSASTPNPAVKVWPMIGLSAIRCNLGGGWRLYCLAKSLDVPGRGWVFRDDLAAYVLSLGVSKKTLRRWMTEARNSDLVSDVQSRFGRWRLILASHHKAAEAVGCHHVGNRRVDIPAAELVSKGWRSVIWAAYQSTHRGRPISRAKMAEITQVPESTQRAYQHESGRIASKPNYAMSDIPASQLDAMKEFTDRAAPFKIYNKETKLWVCGWRLPDSRDVIGLDLRGRGRARKVNKYLRANSNGLSSMRQPLSFYPLRLFNRTQQEFKATNRKLASQDIQPDDLYRLRGERPGCIIWEAVPYAL